jgi:hypothetical protein
MAWIGEKPFGFFLPAFGDIFIRREPLRGFQAFGEILGMQEVVEVLV